jgi:hypothetical protein
MRTTKRITKKQTAVMVARGFSRRLALAHATPSFWALPLGKQRACLRRVLKAQLGVRHDPLDRCVRQWTPAASGRGER